ncbi:hypothetical protein PTKIN_Ptkin11bG0087600 [Pterospermum kingtungense]
MLLMMMMEAMARDDGAMRRLSGGWDFIWWFVVIEKPQNRSDLEKKNNELTLDLAGSNVCEVGYGNGDSTCRISSKSSKLLIKGGTVVNAYQQEIADVYIEDGIIVAVKPNINVGEEVTVIDATGKYVMPGGIDPYTHLDAEFMLWHLMTSSVVRLQH